MSPKLQQRILDLLVTLSLVGILAGLLVYGFRNW
jgi:hypothetical protein